MPNKRIKPTDSSEHSISEQLVTEKVDRKQESKLLETTR